MQHNADLEYEAACSSVAAAEPSQPYDEAWLVYGGSMLP